MYTQHSPGGFWVYNFLLLNPPGPRVWVEKIQHFSCVTIYCVAIYKSGR